MTPGGQGLGDLACKQGHFTGQWQDWLY